MAYTPQEWNNDDPATPLSAARLTHIEEGLEAAAAAADETPTAAQVGAVPTSRTVAGKPLSANVTLTASDVGAAATSHTQAATTVTVAADAAGEIEAGNLQVVLAALAARIVALEDAPA